MEAIAHNKAFAKKVGVPQSVGEDFSKADKGKKFAAGGINMINKDITRHGRVLGAPKNVPEVDLSKYTGKKEGGIMKKESMKEDIKQDKAIVKKAFKMHDSQEHKGGKGTDLSKLKKGGTAMKKMAEGGMGKVKTNTKAPHGDGIAERGKTKAMMPKMGGSTTGMKKGGMAKMKRGGKAG